MKVAIYTRVSTTEQSNDLQINELTRYAIAHDWQIVGVFSDVMSGAKRARPQLDALMNVVRRREADAILVWKFDRFARSLSHLIAALEEFEYYKVAFISLHDSVDTSSPAGRLMFHIIGAMAEFERALIRERVKAGMDAARKRGKRIGRPVVDVKLEGIVTRRSNGESWRDLARGMNVPATTLRRAARKEGIV